MHFRFPKMPTWKLSRLSAHLVLAILVTAVQAPLTSTAQQQMFGRLFPELPPYNAPDDDTLDALTAAVTTTGSTTSPGPLFDDGAASGNNPDGVRAFFTYLGQFLDHDMTLDSLPLPVDFVDPNTIPNIRDQRLNLDSVYGSRKNPNPALYEADGKHLRVNDRDLPRNLDGSAIIGDPRNDENQIIAQIHVAFLRAHNKLIDQGFKFEDARQLMEWRHQWIVVHEFLPEVLDPDVYADVFRANRNHGYITKIQTRYYDPSKAAKAEMPVEFSVGAYRFGHSQVRAAYRMAEHLPLQNSPAPFIQVFSPPAPPDGPPAPPDLRGGRPIADLVPDRVIFWPNFLDVDGFPDAINTSRKIDTLLSSGLFNLPIPGAVAGGSAILAKRNIQRAREYGLPSGQAVARRLGIPVLTNVKIAAEITGLAGLTDDSKYKGEAPLWLYILAEAKIVHDGAKLGPVGSRIVAEVIGGLLAADKNSYIRRGWVPEDGTYRAEDLLREAGVLE